jgi:3alpha(or 20beta)-hydroxysteroid dehydrogenase
MGIHFETHFGEQDDMARLKGKVAIITGGARGQGEAEARLFAVEGAKVVITDVLAAEGEAVAQSIGGMFLHHDVSSEAEWADVVQAVLVAHGRIDVLINNAGIFRRNGLRNTTLAEYRQVIDVNQVGVFLGMQAVAPTMIEQKAGSIVNISSIAGFLAAAGAFAYGASKWAVRGMTKSAGIELAKHGVRVNSIHPGMIDTEMMQEVTGGDATRFARVEKSVPLGRTAAADEVAKVALFLASDDSSYCTATEFVVDGGVTAV